MNAETVTTVAERYPWASWAVWDEEFPDEDCVEQTPERLVGFIRDQAACLSPKVVLLGLNRSDNLSAPFANFHAPTRRHYDYRLKEFIQDDELNRLRGAYMTDLVDEVDPDSQEIDVADADAEVFLEQLRLFGEREYHVICFGNKPFDGLTAYFDADWTRRQPEIKHAVIELEDLTFHVYRVWFYGLYGVHQSKVETLKRQLQQLNEDIG